MAKSFRLDPPFKNSRITLAATEKRVVTCGEAVCFYVPLQGGALAPSTVRVAFGQDRDTMFISEGIFISAPGVAGWNEILFHNTSGAPVTFEYMTTNDPQTLIIT